MLIFLRGGLTPISHTLLAIRVVLLQKQAIVQRFLSLTVHLWFQKWFQQQCNKHRRTKGTMHVLLGIWNQNSSTVIYEIYCSYLYQINLLKTWPKFGEGIAGWNVRSLTGDYYLRDVLDIGVDHKPCGQLFALFWLPFPPIRWTILLSKAYVVIWSFGKPLSPWHVHHMVYEWPLINNHPLDS